MKQDMEFRKVPFEQLVPSPTNPRRHFDKKALDELTESIKKQGIIVPLLVVPRMATGTDLYEIVSGERRYRAAKALGLALVPVQIRELTDQQVLEIQVFENLLRADVHPLDEAEGYARLMKEYKYSAEAIAAKVEKDVSYVYKRLKLVDLVEPAKKLFWDGVITTNHAILIARLTPADQKRALQFVTKTWQAFKGDHDYYNELNPDRSDEKEWADPAQTICSVKDLADFIQKRIHLDLGKAAFDKKSETLVPKAGSCINCPKRSGFNKELFNDITKSPDICTDHACFSAKQTAHVEQLKAQLKSERKKFVEITEDQRKPEGHAGAITERSFKKISGKPCKHARVGIYIDGANKGRTALICNAKKECRQHWKEYQPDRSDPEPTSSSKPQSLKEEIKQKKASLDSRIQDFVNANLGDVFIEEVPKHIDDTLDHAALVWIFKAMDSWYAGGPAKKQLKLKGKPENWKLKDLSRAVKLASFYNLTEEADLGEVEEYVKSLGVDTKEIRAALEAEAREEKEFVESAKEILRLQGKLEQEEAARKSGKAKPVKGVCQICGCTEEKPCKVPTAAGKHEEYCWWMDKTQTLCSNPECVEAARARAAGKKKVKPAKAKKKSGKKRG